MCAVFKKVSDMVSGVLLFDKPLGVSSNGILGKLKYLFGERKVGHTGTLDPLATGLLPVCFGEATKFSADLLEANKSYLATIRLGVTTTTADAEGDVLVEKSCTISRSEIDAILPRFLGEIMQVPPMYSALKKAGKPLYEYARAGITIERPARQITIFTLEVVDYQAPLLTIRVHCSKGTYIRTLAEDIGAALDCGAHLAGLRRESVAHLSLGQSYTIEQLGEMSSSARLASLLPVDALVSTLPSLRLTETLSLRFTQGQRLALHDGLVAQTESLPSLSLVRVYVDDIAAATPVFLGTARIDEYVLAPVRLMR
jgi:tRNA pseudouridine55 synthase